MRKRREYTETGLYHIVIRGVNKQNIFYDNEDRKLFLNLLKKYSKKLNIHIHAYCLMENHVHLEIEGIGNSISLFMQCVCSLYARLFNRKYDRIGHLFQERFASEVINNKEYFLAVFRYILQNPVKAGISKTPNYQWSSYKYYRYINSLVYRKLLIEYLGNEDQLYSFLEIETNLLCLEVELRPSEKENDAVNKIKMILDSQNPVINPNLPKRKVFTVVRKMRDAGLSVRTIARITGVSKHIVQSA